MTLAPADVLHTMFSFPAGAVLQTMFSPRAPAVLQTMFSSDVVLQTMFSSPLAVPHTRVPSLASGAGISGAMASYRSG